MFGLRKKEKQDVHVEVQKEGAQKKTTERCCGKKTTKTSSGKQTSMKNCK